MFQIRRFRPRSSLLAGLAALAPLCAASAEDAVEEIVVRGQASLAPEFASVGNLSRIDEEVLDQLGLVHPNEAFVRVPGVWISRGSGQEHLTAIRSGVLTGPGACGAFLITENGVPIRPAGFCNVNNLFEVNVEQAAAVEVVRGPASALYGGNALLGVVNVVAPQVDDRAASLAFEVGPWDFRQLQGEGGVKTERGGFRAAVNAVDTDGWRTDTGFEQQKGSFVWDTAFGDWTASTLLSATNLDQNTGGFVLGDDAYQDSELRDTNPNPEAYRKAQAVRLSSELVRALDADSALVVTPYLRWSDMDFLQHFLPGQPLEQNGQTSGGVIARWRNAGERLDWTVGAQLEYADTWLEQTQDGPTQGSPFLVETRPPGTHYDYEVTSFLAAGFYDLSWHVTPTVDLVHSLRVERLAYDYENQWLVGNTRDDGTACGFGGCLYTRPADRDDTFTDVATRFGVEYRPVEAARFWATAAVGFRAPQSTELYRLQAGQTVADLESESVRGLEVGLEAGDAKGSVSLTAFVQRAEDLVLRDADRFNITAGETESEGVEFALAWKPLDRHGFDLVGTWAEHTYAFDRDLGGEVITAGNAVDTAPRWLGAARWRYTPLESLWFELEAVYMDEYWMDAANTVEYEGHTLFNLRADWQFAERASLGLRVFNLADERYAERADFAFGNERYFPGQPRRAHVALRVTF
mgnify:FL=1